MSTSTKRAAVLAALALAGVVAYLVYRPVSAPPAPAAGTDAAQRTPGASVSATAAPAALTAVPAPPAAPAAAIMAPEPPAPLAQDLAALRQRAEGGDAQAACRLAVELDRCRRLPALRGSLDRGVDAAAKNGAAADAGLQDLDARLARDQTACAGVGDADTQQAWRYLYQAAAAGHHPAMRRFLLLPPLDAAAGSDAEGWKTYRAHAAELLRRQLDDGDPAAAYFAFWLYQGGAAPGGTPVVVPDAQTALGWALVAQRYAAGPSQTFLADAVARLRERLPEAAQRKAELDAGNWLADHFQAGASQDFSQGLVRESPLECGRPAD